MTPDDVRAAAERLTQFPRAIRSPLRQGRGPGPRLHLCQGADDLPRTQEHRTDRAAGGRRPGLGLAEVHQHRPLGSRRYPGRDPGGLRRGVGPHRDGRCRGRRRRGRRERLRQEGRSQCRRRSAIQRSAGQGRQLPGRGLPGRAWHPAARRCWIINCTCPESWCEDNEACRERRAKVHIPESIVFQTKPEIAAGDDPADGGRWASWLWTGSRPTRSTAATATSSTSWRRWGSATWSRSRSTPRSGRRIRPRASRRTGVGAGCRRKPSRDVGASRGRGGRRHCRRRRWRRLCVVRQGAKGSAVLRIRGGAGVGGAARRSGDTDLAVGPAVVGGEARDQVLRQQRARRRPRWRCWPGWPARGTRSRSIFEDAKSYLGMAQYETRSWIGWHHHMSLVALAHLFITLTRRDLQKKTPELTLDRTVRLLQRAMEVPGLVAGAGPAAGGLPHPSQ